MPTTPHIERHFIYLKYYLMGIGGCDNAGFVPVRFLQRPLYRHHPLRSGALTVLVGGLAAGVAFGLARIIE